MCPGHVFYAKAPFRNPQDSCHQAQFSSVSQSCPTLCDQVDCSMPGFPVHHQLPEPTQTRVGPSRQWCHPTISPSVVPFSSHLQSFPASGAFPMSWFFASGGQSIAVSASALILPMNIQTALLWDGPVGSPCSPRASAESSPTPQFNSIHSSAFSFLYSPTLTSMHDYWINHILD